MTQRYASPVAKDRMSNGLCPECGTDGGEHNSSIQFWDHPGCDLTPNGVADRIAQYRLDEERR